MARTKFPLQNVSAVDVATGRFVPDWYDVLKQFDVIYPISSSITATFSVPSITPGNTSVTVSTGAISENNASPGVVHTYVGYGGVVQNLYDSFATIAFYINSLRADLTADQTAVAALNTRLTALENKVNAVISDLATRFP